MPPPHPRSITVWRLTKAKYAQGGARSALSGYGSTLRSGRWHPRGRSVAYCASPLSLALLETLVHVERPDLLRFDYVAVPAPLQNELLERLAPEDLPDDWQAWPHPASTQALGAPWFDEQRSVALEVPRRWSRTSGTSSSTRSTPDSARSQSASPSRSP